ncbi:Dna2/Cas4 domain-containing protein [Vibrio sp. S11_S32]|uniref:CRISPR-associated protein Cas4 n=1 Tax=Vibrio sp. S11_S32 TaxID=2720225 RepID=UPI001680420B|nr:Dna2/Cas4 domain-containing protein [Vibrio sp. S11_S32]MBD1577118.1 Dna2/Cas4 domain-containing protein [Vibrio sp. S11_S32]
MFLIAIVVTATLIIITSAYLSSKKGYVSTQFGFKGRLVYVDDNKHPVLLCHKFKLKSKPDFIFETSSTSFTEVEYKSRAKGFYKSDVQQMIATAICARANGYNVTKGILATKERNYPLDLNKSTEKLYKMISKDIDNIKVVRLGRMPEKTTEAKKCKSCGHRNTCESIN